jgi:hypothetical protein
MKVLTFIHWLNTAASERNDNSLFISCTEGGRDRENTEKGQREHRHWAFLGSLHFAILAALSVCPQLTEFQLHICFTLQRLNYPLYGGGELILATSNADNNLNEVLSSQNLVCENTALRRDTAQ